MTNITAVFKSNKKSMQDRHEDYKDILCVGVKYFSGKKINAYTLEVTWILETEDYGVALEKVHESINLEMLETYDIELLSINED